MLFLLHFLYLLTTLYPIYDRSSSILLTPPPLKPCNVPQHLLTKFSIFQNDIQSSVEWHMGSFRILRLQLFFPNVTHPVSLLCQTAHIFSFSSDSLTLVYILLAYAMPYILFYSCLLFLEDLHSSDQLENIWPSFNTQLKIFHLYEDLPNPSPPK